MSNYPAIHVAVEIGTSKTCLAVAEVNKDNSLKILGVTETKSTGVRKGEISNFHQARRALKTVLVEAEKQPASIRGPTLGRLVQFFLTGLT